MTGRPVIRAVKSRAPVSCAHALTMWAPAAKCEGTCESNVRSLHWQESSDGQGGWLASGCDGGTVGVSWVGNRTSEVAASDPEDSVACTEEACFYKSHFILKGHVGEVRNALALSMYIRTNTATYRCLRYICGIYRYSERQDLFTDFTDLECACFCSCAGSSSTMDAIR